MSTYAVFKAGGRQFRAAEGDTLLVDRLNVLPGEEVRFDQVLMIQGETVKVGSPLIDGAAVVTEVQDEVKGEKLTVFKFKRRKTYARKRGHRQRYTRVKVTRIEG
jgi:large subunit ribosomal protein L21